MRISAVVLCSIFLSLASLAQTANTGKTLFIAKCAGCHGEDGTGGGLGPGILEVRNSRATSRPAVRELIRRGIPEVGMPAFPMPEAELDAVANYVLALKAPKSTSLITPHTAGGNPQAGATFFANQGKCLQCHMVRGQGGIAGPDLSAVGSSRSAAQIEQALRQPPGGNGVTVRLLDGREIRGTARNESAFDLQVMGVDGRIHLLTKDKVQEITHGPKSLMPTLKASETELRDLVAYLASLTKPVSGATLPPPPLLGSGISFADVVRPKPGEWPTYNGNVSGNRFSPLNQINTGNVARLVPKWMFTLPGTHRPLEGTPVVVDGIMYMSAANEAYALDARTGRQIWRYSQPRTKGLVPTGDAVTGINRGVAVLGDRIFMATDHAHLIALHRLTGQLLWDVEMADYQVNYGATGAPLVVNDMVIAGVSGGDEGVRGFLSAYKASTGERVWRFWTVPGRGEPGSETWVGNAIEHPGGATWITGTYDPEANLLYWGVGNPAPDHNGDERQGDNLYTCSILALEPATGKLRWYRQMTPHNLHDWDATQTPMLVNADFHGRPRKLLLQANRNGFFYVLDRLTGELLLAEPFVKKLTWATGIGSDGRPKLVPGNDPTPEGTRTCPTPAGATNWPSAAFNPEAGQFLVFAQEACAIYTKKTEKWEPGKSIFGGSTRRAPGEPSEKFLRALDIQTGKVAWEIPKIGGGILASGLMATAGGLVFYGDDSGAVVAADTRNGKLLWHFNTSQSFKAGPMTYMIDGEQYVTIAAGSTVLAFALR